ncbi:MAG: 4-(cytidine 5'-diphospho)-2-C-methyl-D-erythritol kinase [Clostridia bacterium]|nr:4-(cytidine 5'-diphospho)-2-C-methyl-D-erythritol kinase [Clostridia bacterium]MBR6725851.1 4-(cytidine 5'-diphospho)-2-C-methyl-D-erythritol kinase [Clostridia bacterium]
MNRITVFAPAKINLFLEVHGIMDNGYHNIESIMQTVSFGDTIDIEKLPTMVGQQTPTIELYCSDDRLPCDESNIVYKAASVFFAETGIVSGVSIRITKLIPISAGLAGGSTNAAATIIALNKLFGTGFTVDEMCNLCAHIGADVSFCLKRGTCLASGVGEKLTRIDDMPDCDIVIGIGNGRVSTRWAYHRIDDMPDREIRDIHTITDAIKAQDLKAIAANLYNTFENVSPHESEIKEILNENGALASSMSGSGSAVYGIFDDPAKAKTAYGHLLSAGFRAFLCKPIGKRDAGFREMHN